jgi:hypothetical protein
MVSLSVDLDLKCDSAEKRLDGRVGLDVVGKPAGVSFRLSREDIPFRGTCRLRRENPESEFAIS